MDVVTRPSTVSVFCVIVALRVTLSFVLVFDNLVSGPSMVDLAGLVIGVLLIVAIRNIWKMRRKGIKQFVIIQLIDLTGALILFTSAEYPSAILLLQILGAKLVPFALLAVLVLPHWRWFGRRVSSAPAPEGGREI